MTTPLFQEALIEAKKLREAAANEAKNAVLEAVSPLIKQMIDKEISGVILEQEEPTTPDASTASDTPPPPPPPSPDAGATGPVSPTPASGSEPTPSLPTMAPATAIGSGAPPIVPAGTPVETKIESDPTTGEPKIVIDVSSIFAPQASDASTKTQTSEPAPAPAPTAELPPSGELPPPPEGEQVEQVPSTLEEIYRAVHKLLAEQQAPPAAPATPPAAPDAAAVNATPPAAPGAPVATPPAPDATGATPPAGITPPTAPGATPPAAGTGVAVDSLMTPPAAGAQPPTVPAPMPPAPTDAAATPPAAPSTPPPIAPAPNAAGAPPAPAAPMQEYKEFKHKLAQLSETVTTLAKTSTKPSVMAKQTHERAMFALYESLVGLKKKNAISSRLFASNEGRLDLLHENLNLIYSYTQNPLTKGKTMKNNSLKDFARSLFEGAEGFEKEVGHVDPAGDSEGGSAEHAHHVSGNPKGVKAEAEKAKFATKEKSEWPGKPAPTSLLEQLEEEIAEMMGGLEEEESMEEEGMHEAAEEEEEGMEEAVLEISDEEVMMEARKARARLKALREQAEDEVDMEEEGGDDHLSLTIDLDGVSGSEVSNVNVSLDGEELDVDMAEEGGEEEEEEEGMMTESRQNKVLRTQLAETQLLTARSLYVNKLFVRDDLSGAQKRKIVEYLDSARTLAEAKEIYNRVTRVLNTAKKNGMMNESVTTVRPTQVLTEAAGIVEPSFDVSRWQILAGVKRNAR